MEVTTLNIHQDIYRQLNGYFINNQIPNIIFHGASGTGKKQIVTNFIDKIYNNDRKLIKSNVMFVNCSHGKGIRFIREDLKFFAKANLDTTGCLQFKTIILLNADYLTNDAQSALRRCIELFSYTTRFFMIVENKHKLLVPILSRFCEIYVPENFINNKLLNLHQYSLNKSLDTDAYERRHKQQVKEVLKSICYDKREKNLTNADLIEYCKTIYINGYSCLDIINAIKDDASFSEEQKTYTEIYYLKIKSEIRCERLLLFSVLNYALNRDLQDIYKIKFI